LKLWNLVKQGAKENSFCLFKCTHLAIYMFKVFEISLTNSCTSLVQNPTINYAEKTQFLNFLHFTIEMDNLSGVWWKKLALKTSEVMRIFPYSPFQSFFLFLSYIFSVHQWITTYGFWQLSTIVYFFNYFLVVKLYIPFKNFHFTAISLIHLLNKWI